MDITPKQASMNQLIECLDKYQWSPVNSAFSKAFYVCHGDSTCSDVELQIEIVEGSPQDLGDSIDKFKPITSHQEYWLLISLESESQPEVKVDFDYEFRGKRAVLLESNEDFDKAFELLKILEEYLSKIFISWLNNS
jgi:hypothetical protein